MQFCFGALRLGSRCHCTALALCGLATWRSGPLSSHFCRKTALRSNFPRISAGKLPCVRTFLAFLQENCPALALASHFCRKTARCSHFPRISAGTLLDVRTALRNHCAPWPLSCVATSSVALCDGVTLVYIYIYTRVYIIPIGICARRT